MSSNEIVDSSDAAVAEALLDLSHASTGSPRLSANSYRPHIDLDRATTGLASFEPLLSAQHAQIMDACHPETDSDHQATDEEGHRSDAKSRKVTESSPKRIPTRCKCGKRVSADHPPCKSELMLLCERFQDCFCRLSASGEPTRIDLNDVTETLACGRRRLYDITIAYEAAEVLQRTGKLSYVWKGTAHLPELIKQLKSEEELQEPVCRKGTTLPAQNRQGNYTMWTLSRKLMRHLLTTQGPVSLSDAADHLIGDSVKGAKRLQTQMTVERRLYDIGSILSTLDLITRIYADGKRQPSFAWKYNTSSQDQAMAPSANFPLDSAEVDGLMGLPSPSAFMRCQSPSSGKTERLSGFKRKHSEDSNSGLSTATNLDSRPSMSFTGPYPQYEALDAQMGSPGISSPWQAIAFSQGLSFGPAFGLGSMPSQFSLPTSFPALNLPDSWSFPQPRVSMLSQPTLCRPHATRGPVSMQF